MINDFFNILLPQGCLGLFVIIQLVCAMIISPRFYKVARFVSLTAVALSIALLSTVQVEPQYFGFRNAVMSDSYTLLFHFIILLCAFFVILLTENIAKTMKQNTFVFQAILLSSILGALCVVSANDILTLFVSLELLNFPTYFLIASAKGYYSKEASFKYLITSAVSTGVFLFGASYLYGITGSLNFNDIYETVIEQSPSMVYSFASIMVVLGLLAKLAIFPFANWVIDVYKGCESSVLAFLSTIPKLAVFAILCRLLVFPLGNSFELTLVIAITAIVTGFWANTCAIRSQNVKAVLACSTAANASYVLLAACLLSVYNLSTVIFYLVCYVLMNIAVFSFLNICETNNIGNQIEQFKGLVKKNFGLCLAYTIALLGLAGFPITSGFVAKIYLFSAIVHSGLIFIPFLIALLILTVIALFYYLKLIRPLYDENENSVELKVSFSQKLVLWTTVIVTVLIGVFPEKLIELCRFIAYNI